MTNQPPQYGQQPNEYQPQHSGQPYQQSPQPSGGLNGMGLASVIIGAIGLAVCWIPWIGFIGILIGIVGLVFGILGLALEKYRGRRMLAIIGTVISGIAFVLSTFVPALTGVWWTIGVLDDSGAFDELQTQIEQDFETYNYDDESDLDEPTTDFGPSEDSATPDPDSATPEPTGRDEPEVTLPEETVGTP
ncbi:hypothetical protein [Gulosibacter molinativorax]|uniref:DUF4190 domain-containing protein n=1 Tax=Gulosibacter molinativorax TaxID=256821 RepID=A0ABT7C949_9MICO|nr:hypothetical protein [Gulosibacter molinativorax]MDJ1371719.1 hypothetical protein [Gulosibacter molinativorax]QUY63140.1 Hypotetical protein [Gulosibacter molinativorax]